MATALGESQTITSTDQVESQTTSSVEPPPTTADTMPTQSGPESPSLPRRQSSNVHDSDPNAFRITILLASSGYRTHISVNRAFLEKASLHEGDGFPVSALKTALWKDWPSGMSLFRHLG